MALKRRSCESAGFDVEAPVAEPSAGLGSSSRHRRRTSTRIVDAVPGSSEFAEGGGTSSEGSASLQPNRPMAALSDDSSDGFSLVDDEGDSLPGSEALSQSSQSGGSSSNLPSSTGTIQGKEILTDIMMPSSFYAVRAARRCWWILWIVGTVSVTTSLWAMAKNESTERLQQVELLTDGGTTHWDTQHGFETRVALLQQIWRSRLEQKLYTMDVLVTFMTSIANSAPLTWPFVSIPDFERHTTTLQSYTFWMPLVSTGADSEIWEVYSQESQNDIQNETNTVSDTIFETDSNGNLQPLNESSSYSTPIWQQSSPALSSLVNYNLHSHEQLRRSIEAVIEYRLPVLSRTFFRDEFSDEDLFLDSILSEGQATAFLFYPIFDSLKNDSSLVGILATAISWDSLLAVNSMGYGPNIQISISLASCSNDDLGNSSSVVLELGQDGSVTLQADDKTRKRNATIDLTSELSRLGRPTLSEVPAACQYTLQVAEVGAVNSAVSGASSNFDIDEDRVPINIVTGVLVFAFTIASAFWWFDRKVRYRDLVMSREANRTKNMVTSLFPPQFHARIFQTNSEENVNGLPKSPDLQKVENAVHNFFEVPLKGESEHESEEDSFGNCAAEAAAPPSKTGQARKGPPEETTKQNDFLSSSSRFLMGRGGNADSLGQSNHSTGKLPSLRGGLLARTATMRVIRKNTAGIEPPMQRLLSFLTLEANNLPAQSEHGSADMVMKDEPIADLFPDATVMFADISGFTAWSSVREPAQVFKLLETIYRSFDRIARKRKVFKVETIGDCYVAVTGLPEPQPDHAIIMAKFSKECMNRMRDVTRKLELTLGPETADLCMRFGIHSGPVTAGVLRGEKSRFQLFGDTVNYASRMESTGQRNRIQGSQATADLLIMAGKATWIHPREELVIAKGKGKVQTYWINPRSNSSSASGSVMSLNDSTRSLGEVLPLGERTTSMVQLKSRPKKSIGDKKSSSHHSRSGRSNHDSGSDVERTDFDSSRRSMLASRRGSNRSQIWTQDSHMDEDDEDFEDYDGFDDINRQERLIDWNIEIMAWFLKRLIAWRQETNGEAVGSPRPRRGRRSDVEELKFEKMEGQNALDEIREIIPLAASSNSHLEHFDIDASAVELPLKVERQLQDYVTMIACMYRDNFFHNFEHASHVLMSSQKLLKRVISADRKRVHGIDDDEDYTSIIASDPLIQFAIVFAALVHDVDHTGVPNNQLIKEKAHVATLYNNKSVAEQNSLDLAWDLLMSKEYRDLQRAIFATQAELKRFRQLVVNVVIATDIFDPDMIKVRNSRWQKAFGDMASEAGVSEVDSKNLKATIVIEYIMQASDVSHTMQHWQVYQKWNERLFEEMYSAYQVRRGDKDPSTGWYQGELWFFDNYIIPLAKKLKECGVFGAASDQCLQYAESNRRDWELKGEEIVEQLVQRHAQEL